MKTQTDLIKPVLAEKPIEEELPYLIGDALWGDGHGEGTGRYLRPIHGGKPSKFASCGVQYLPLYVVSQHPIMALRRLGIDEDVFERSEYTDAYTDYRAYGCLPVALLTSDPQRYRPALEENPPQFGVDFALDCEWHAERVDAGGLLSIDSALPVVWEGYQPWDVPEILFGTGYTDYTLKTDGSSELLPATIALDNGDTLVVWYWNWINK